MALRTAAIALFLLLPLSTWTVYAFAAIMGFLWLGVAFVLGGAAQWLAVAGGLGGLGLGALHALSMGCLASLMLAMAAALALATGAVASEVTSRGWISYLNDLHKGRNSGGEWSLFIDIFSFACLVFAITGLFLLQLHSAKRKSTWPLVGFGLAIPAAIAVIFIH